MCVGLCLSMHVSVRKKKYVQLQAAKYRFTKIMCIAFAVELYMLVHIKAIAKEDGEWVREGKWMYSKASYCPHPHYPYLVVLTFVKRLRVRY